MGIARTACGAVPYACDGIEPSLSGVLDLRTVLDMLSKRTYYLGELCFAVNLILFWEQTGLKRKSCVLCVYFCRV